MTKSSLSCSLARMAALLVSLLAFSRPDHLPSRRDGKDGRYDGDSSLVGLSNAHQAAYSFWPIVAAHLRG